MRSISVSNDIIPIGEFKTGLSKCLKSVQETGHPLIITQNGRPAGVLLSPSEYDDLVHSKAFVQSVQRGMSDSESGNVYTTEELQLKLKKRRGKRGPE